MDEVFAQTMAAPVYGHLLLAGNSRGWITLDPNRLADRLRAIDMWRPSIETKQQQGAVSVPVPDHMLVNYFASVFNGVLAKRVSLFDDRPARSLSEDFEAALRATRSAANKDQRPRAIFYSLELLTHVLGDPGRQQPEETASFSDRASAYLWRWPLIVFALPLLLSLLSSLRPRDKIKVVPVENLSLFFCAFITGLFGMVCAVTLIIFFQNQSGYVYTEIGILTGVFMLGLAAGAQLSGRLNVGRLPAHCVVLLLLGLLVLMGVCCLVIPVMTDRFYLFGIRTTIAMAILIVGSLDGATFPLLTHLAQRFQGKRSSALLYASDLCGACLGAIFTSLFFIPILGTTYTLGYAAVLVLLSFLALLPLLRRNQF